ncbi:pilus assembly protein TadG-related protein [Specibacter cremeus]|uniref:pilus assembly protein TadG-related protein n=1 Tax=Specibacter cremeus TaxID=1629051 RepID=UPI000F7925E1|nr:pilus assembly protein TadG-related protein [Specibacter cremeus]
MVLLIGFVLLALLLVTVVAAASSLYIGQKRLLSLADGAALAAADTFRVAGSAARDPTAALTQAGVAAAAAGYLATNTAGQGLDGVALAPGTGTPDGRTARVSLTAVVHPLFINFLVPAGVTIEVTGSARSQLVQ